MKKGEKHNELPQDIPPSSNHVNELHKDTDFVKDGVQRIKEETSRLSGKALYLRVLELIKQGNITLEDWHAIGYQEIYERLMKDGFDILKIKSLNAKWKASVGIAKIPKLEIGIEKIMRVSRALRRYEDYFSPKKTSLTADRLEGFLKTFAIGAAGAKIERLPLFSWNNLFYGPDGEIRIARELERIRKLMVQRADAIHALYDPYVKQEMERLGDTREAKELEKFLSLPGDLEIKNTALDEISARLKARSVRAIRELNMPPQDGIFRIALKDCTAEGRLRDGNLVISGIPSNPEHLLTYALNANLFSEKAAEHAKEWFDFTVKSMGIDGARKFYEHAGYLMVTKYPLPTERTILVIVGDPGSGKGTHLAAIEELLSFGELTLFAKASPHKLADPKEHFSKQNLQNKLALIAGDLKHTKIRDFSEINDLFGGEHTEMEKKFRDPTNERPIFKGIWASTPPLFKVDQAGGAWRRILMVFTSGVLEKDRDNNLKPRMLGMIDGVFLNALIGLAYLSTNGWKFTNEQSDAEIEELWEFHSDSVQVWAENLNPEPETIESDAETRSSTLDGKAEKQLLENIGARQVIDSLYEQYAAWCRKKQIEPVGQKTFSAWLGNHDYVIKKRTIEEGNFEGKRKYVTYVSWNEEKGSDSDPKMNRTGDQISWEAYFSRAPLTFELVSDSHGQSMRNEDLKNDNVTSRVTWGELPSWIGRKLKHPPEARNIGSGDNVTMCPIHFENQKADQKVTHADPEPKPDLDPIHDPKPDPNAIMLQDAEAALRIIVSDGFHAIPADSRLSMDGKRFLISVTKPQSSERERILRDRLAALGFELKNTGAIGPLIFSAPIREVV